MGLSEVYIISHFTDEDADASSTEKLRYRVILPIPAVYFYYAALYWKKENRTTNGKFNNNLIFNIY